MSKLAAHLSLIVLAALAHGWAYWSAMGGNSLGWSSFFDFLPFLFIVISIVGSTATLTFLAGFLAQNQFKMKDSAVGMFAVVYIIWFLSAFVLYVTNIGVDDYSSTLGVFIYMPIHSGATFVVNLFVIGIFSLFVREEIK